MPGVPNKKPRKATETHAWVIFPTKISNTTTWLTKVINAFSKWAYTVRGLDTEKWEDVQQGNVGDLKKTLSTKLKAHLHATESVPLSQHTSSTITVTPADQLGQQGSELVLEAIRLVCGATPEPEACTCLPD